MKYKKESKGNGKKRKNERKMERKPGLKGNKKQRSEIFLSL